MSTIADAIPTIPPVLETPPPEITLSPSKVKSHIHGAKEASIPDALRNAVYDAYLFDKGDTAFTITPSATIFEDRHGRALLLKHCNLTREDALHLQEYLETLHSITLYYQSLINVDQAPDPTLNSGTSKHAPPPHVSFFDDRTKVSAIKDANSSVTGASIKDMTSVATTAWFDRTRRDYLSTPSIKPSDSVSITRAHADVLHAHLVEAKENKEKIATALQDLQDQLSVQQTVKARLRSEGQRSWFYPSRAHADRVSENEIQLTTLERDIERITSRLTDCQSNISTLHKYEDSARMLLNRFIADEQSVDQELREDRDKHARFTRDLTSELEDLSRLEKAKVLLSSDSSPSRSIKNSPLPTLSPASSALSATHLAHPNTIPLLDRLNKTAHQGTWNVITKYPGAKLAPGKQIRVVNQIIQQFSTHFTRYSLAPFFEFKASSFGPAISNVLDDASHLTVDRCRNEFRARYALAAATLHEDSGKHLMQSILLTAELCEHLLSTEMQEKITTDWAASDLLDSEYHVIDGISAIVTALHLLGLSPTRQVQLHETARRDLTASSLSSMMKEHKYDVILFQEELQKRLRFQKHHNVHVEFLLHNVFKAYYSIPNAEWQRKLFDRFLAFAGSTDHSNITTLHEMHDEYRALYRQFSGTGIWVMSSKSASLPAGSFIAPGEKATSGHSQPTRSGQRDRNRAPQQGLAPDKFPYFSNLKEGWELVPPSEYGHQNWDVNKSRRVKSPGTDKAVNYYWHSKHPKPKWVSMPQKSCRTCKSIKNGNSSSTSDSSTSHPRPARSTATSTPTRRVSFAAISSKVVLDDDLQALIDDENTDPIKKKQGLALLAGAIKKLAQLKTTDPDEDPDEE